MDIKELRARANRAHVNATKKVSKMKRHSAAAISGTELDPRKPRANIKRYNTKQLTAYVNRLEAFNKRDVGFVGSKDGLLQRSRWNEYKRLERKYDRAGAKYDKAIASLKLPGQDMTIAQKRATMSADRVTAFGTATNKPYSKVNRNSMNIKGPGALNALIDQMSAKTNPKFLEGHISEQRKQFEQMLETINDKDLTELSRGMTDEQFSVAWNEGGLADAVVSRYVVSGIEIGRAGQTIDDNANADAQSIINWAKSLETKP